MSVFSFPDFDQHEEVVFGNDPSTGLKAIIAVHNSHLGPATGGCRMYPYVNDEDALHDVLRLSRGMTYKSAMAGIPCGGGKSVIIGNPQTDKSPELFKAMGKLVQNLSGQYVAAQDSGIAVSDLAEMGHETRYVCGIKNVQDDRGNTRSGDPSPATGYGVFCGIKAAVKHKLGKDDVSDVTVAIQGVGNVGFDLAQRLHEEGAKLFVCDVNAANLERAKRELNAEIVDGADFFGLEVDVLAPCALGGAINDKTIHLINAPIIAGAANNQLATQRHGDILHERGILYAPDYVINAGGIVHVHYMHTGRSWTDSTLHIAGIGKTLTEIFQRSDATNQATALVADQIAEQRFRPV